MVWLAKLGNLLSFPGTAFGPECVKTGQCNVGT